MAIGTAVSVATIYLTQPILNLLGPVLHASTAEMGLVTTATQVGYAAGIVLLVPLGDIVAKKRLITGKLLLLALALGAVVFSKTALAMMAGSLAIGLFATAAQDLVPLAAELALPENRGHAVGTVQAGLLVGILASRVFSGVLAQWVGWRAPFLGALGLVLLLDLMACRRIPLVVPEHRSTYGGLLRSIGEILRREPLVLLATAGQGFLGLTFSAFWTVLSFHLGPAPFSLSPSAIGAFALAGLAGAAVAPLAGRLSDRRGPLPSVRAAIALVAVSFVAMLAFPGSLAVLVAATLTFDLGVQVAMVSHQTIIYAIEPRARSRINAVFIGGLFAFFGVGSLGATFAFTFAGWPGVVALCLGSCGLAAVVHLALSRRWRGRPRPDGGIGE